MVVEREMRAQQPHGRQADGAALEQLQDRRKTPRRSCDSDAVVGLLLGQAEEFPAVAEERAVAGPEVHVAGIELREVGDQEDHGPALANSEVLDASHQLRVGEVPEGCQEVRLHVSLYRAWRPAQVRKVEIFRGA